MQPLIPPNGVVRSVQLLQRTPWYTWITVWPFSIVFVALCVSTLDPTLFWGRVTYLIWMKYVDFFHGVMFPVIIIGNTFFALLTVWSVRVSAALLFRRCETSVLSAAARMTLRECERLPQSTGVTHVHVKVHQHKGEDEILPLKVDSRGHIYFNFQRRKWTFNAASGSSQFEKPILPTKHPFSFYEQQAGIQTDAARDDLRDAFGSNELTIEIPTFMELFVDHAFAPFFVFQMFCVLLWCLDEYWYYSMFTGFMMILLECLVVTQRLRNMRSLQQMSQITPTQINVWRNKSYVLLSNKELLPLDVISIPMGVACPADVLLVSGTCVVNESMLTGESTPQMKECIPFESNEALSAKKHSRHILFAGTQLLLSSRQTSCGADAIKAKSPYPCPSTNNDNAIGVVLRIGLETKQGRLVRTIWHSQSRISQNSGEAFVFIAFLLLFAIAAVAYVLHRDLGDPSRSRWKLFLTCTQILTSVVPPELPMELALAVNTSLLALVKLRVFCTEPYRIPFAGKVDTCCFDKTGTLTTDEMLFCGVDCCDAKQLRNKAALIPQSAEEVLASCHSLVGLAPSQGQIVAPNEKELAGDAMEKAAVEALGWKCPRADFIHKDFHDDPHSSKQRAREKSITTLVRFPFAAALKRMSCIVSDSDGLKCVVTKGAPEVLKHLLKYAPEEYDMVYRNYTKAGLRVIALARRILVDTEASRAAVSSMSREAAESELVFAGFAVFKCPLKSDSRATIENLQGGSHRCSIITGDSLETALAVAQDVSILPKSKDDAPMILAATVSGPSSTEIEWVEIDSRRKATVAPSSLLCINAEVLTDAQLSTVCNSPWISQAAVWARCAPRQKETIVSALKSRGHVVLMAGDGTNDVGGLKQAHVGIAVLNSALLQQSVTAAATGQDPLSQAVANFKVSELPRDPGPNAGFSERVKYEFAKARRLAETKQKERLEETLRKQKDQAVTVKQQPEQHAATSPDQENIEAMAKSMFNEVDDIHSAPMVKLGDASIAAPFTCKSKKMESICDLVRLGRCTLATTVQMYKILALNCLVTAYTLSVLYSDGVKFGDKQMMFSGMLLAACFLLLSRSKPVESLSRERPIATVFHPYIVFSILGQFVIHLVSFIYSVQLVRSIDADAVSAQRSDVDNAEFKPSLLNSIVFLMSTLMNVVTFAVNYCGKPFMTSLSENRPLLILIGILGCGVAFCALEIDPDINDMLEIVKFPSDGFRNEFLRILLTDVVGSVLIEHISRRIFGRFARR